MAAASALRETSGLFANVQGYRLLGETLTLRKMLACTVIAAATLITG
ncbi:hypothetical protein JHU04_000811 [Brenneria sp. 4F2]|nr:hypothetical protein [Brenneria bubanii]